MKFMHLSDLHIGKRLLEYSLLEDQRYMLEQILSIIDDVCPDAVVLAGDIYDKSIPSAEAVQLCDWFLSELSGRALPTFVISGNHDSAERVAFGSKLMQASKMHIAPVYDGKVAPITLYDAHGPVNFYLLPFVKPTHVRAAFPDSVIESYTDAVSTAISRMEIDPSQRNVLVTHQYYVTTERYLTQDIAVGDSDEVDCAVLAPFDYAALGHIHAAGDLSDTIRYCGSPLKYALSAAKQKKDITVVTMEEKGVIRKQFIPLPPRRDMVHLVDRYDNLTAKAFYDTLDLSDLYYITLTDEEDVPEAVAKLRVIYPNLLKLEYDNTRTRNLQSVQANDDLQKKEPIDLFASLYELQNNTAMSQEQYDLVSKLIGEIWEEQA